MSYKPILEEIIPKLWVGDKEGYPIAERRGYSILAACKDGSGDCHRAVLGYTSLGAPRTRITTSIGRMRSTWLSTSST